MSDKVTDKALNNGYICSLHKIGYITECPTCAFEKKGEVITDEP